MALAELLPDVDVPRDIVVRGLTLDSRSVQSGDAFVAIAGEAAEELQSLLRCIAWNWPSSGVFERRATVANAPPPGKGQSHNARKAQAFTLCADRTSPP